MIEPIYPLTDEQVKSLEDFQKSPNWHSYTCPNGHGDLCVDSFGLMCTQCLYTQKLVHEWTIDGSWRQDA